MGYRLFHIFVIISLIVGFFVHPIRATVSSESNVVHQCCLSSPLACSINDFGESLVKTIVREQNFFISPVSIYLALAMVYLGAEGETSRQISRALNLPSSGLHNQTELQTSMKNLLESISNRNDDEDGSLFIANGIFMKLNTSINENYKNNVQNFYHTVVETVDFFHDPEDAREIINRFAAENTGNKIAPLLSEPLATSVVMAIMNAVYFKGFWETAFPDEQTTSGLFFINNCIAKRVEVMNVFNSEFPFYINWATGDKFLELPYSNKNISMLLVLRGPTQESELSMDSEMLCYVKQNLQRTEMNHVALPKFQLRHKQELVPLLRELGIEDVFDDRANLRGIRQEGDLKVSTIFHEAVIDVDEQGSEAASVTNVVMVPVFLNPNRFIADRPFSFYIVDNTNDIVLFSGHVHNP